MSSSARWPEAKESTEDEQEQQEENTLRIFDRLSEWFRKKFGKTNFVNCYFFQRSAMASATANPCVGSGGGGGPLSFMGCVREASPQPLDHRSFGLSGNHVAHGYDVMPKGQ